MGINKLQPATTSSSVSANAITVTSPYLPYDSTISLDSGIYTITCVNTTIASVELFSDTSGLTSITKVYTTSGTVSFNLGIKNC